MNQKETPLTITLFLGGVRSGKSQRAEEQARQHKGPVTFVATARPDDEELEERIQAHRKQRPSEWNTLEPPHNLLELAERQSSSPDELYLVDEVTLLVSDWLDQGHQQEWILDQFRGALETIKNQQTSWIFVSGIINRGVVPKNPETRLFRDSLGMVNQILADHADAVYSVQAGLLNPLKKPTKQEGNFQNS